MAAIPIVSLAVAALALAFAFGLRKKFAALEQELGGFYIMRSSLKGLEEKVDNGLSVTRSHLAAVAHGETLDRAMIEQGAPFLDITGAQAAELRERVSDLYILDVRSHNEWSSGHIDGAAHVPIDLLEHRIEELPSPETPVLLYCAGGGRSAAGCEILSRKGFRRLYNMADGIGGWKQPLAR